MKKTRQLGKNRANKLLHCTLVALLFSVSSCQIIDKLKQSFQRNNNPNYDSGVTYVKNGQIAEKELKTDAVSPLSHNSISAPVKQSTKSLEGIERAAIILESFDARISSNESSSSYSFTVPSTNSYISDIKKSDIKSIRIYNDSVSCKIVKYKFTQTLAETRDPINIVFLMDHSGSMGEDRANILQAAVDSAINYIQPEDEITLIKFDSRAVKLITSKKKSDLQSFLRPVTGLSNFGYATAIQDAIQMGIDVQEKSNIKNKMIVILTDGVENSSTNSMDINQLITSAKKSKTVINAFGFGSYVDRKYLEFISGETGGYFKQLYSRNEIKSIFNHSIFRVNNNFKISFSPCMFGNNLKLVTEVKLGDSIYSNSRLIYNSYSLGESIEFNVLFDFDKHNIKTEYLDELSPFVEFLKNYPNVTVEIQGHTDSDGDDKHNFILSENRAKSIKKYLVNKGIQNNRISAVGYGENSPKYPNDTDENKQLNRRIEARITGN